MLAALSDSPTRSPTASTSQAYTPTEQLVQQISRGKQGKGAAVMGLLDGLNRRRPGRHSMEGGDSSPAAGEQKGMFRPLRLPSAMICHLPSVPHHTTAICPSHPCVLKL